MLSNIYLSRIVKAVVMHEAALKAQAKKMNVDSLRSNADDNESAEVRIAKVSLCFYLHSINYFDLKV